MTDNERKVIEECSELIQAICKADRFGYDSFHPDRPHSNNALELWMECDDVINAINKLRSKPE